MTSYDISAGDGGTSREAKADAATASGSGTRVWVPMKDMLTDLPDGLVADLYDGRGDPPATIGDVEFYVMPYMVGTGARDLMADMPRLRVVQTLTAGVDAFLGHVPAGVTLCNARGLHNAATAEHTVTLMLASLNLLPEFGHAATRGEWAPRLRDGLADKTVLLVGYGAIGEAVERRLDGFECELLRVARQARDGVSAVTDLPALLPRADVVVLLLPATDETRNLMDAAMLARMRDGALLVNMARGSVVDADALLAETRSGRLRAALDVTEPEPLPAEHPLWRLPNVLITPHVGGASQAFLPRAVRVVHDQLRRFAAGEPLANIITGAY